MVLVPCAVNTQRVPHTANEPGKPGSTPPNWVLRTAFGPASLAGLSAVRSTRAQHLEQPWEADAERQQQAEAQMELGCATEYLVQHGSLRAVPDQT